ncbi:MAG: hypothetical protein ACXU98_09765 [Syntrophales bacterium]
MDNARKTSVNGLLSQVVDAFKEPGKLAATMAETQKWVTPSSKWSISNQMLLALANTRDARGIQQWNEAERRVKKGTKAVYILAPITVKKELEEVVDSPDGTNATRISEVPVATAFRAVPVFRVEDTLGWNAAEQCWEEMPLSYNPRKLPSLTGKAEEWGLQVHYTAMENGLLGTYSPSNQKIRLPSEEPTVFYHELSHAAHHRLTGDEFKGIPKWKQETVAELAATVLAILYENDYPAPSKTSYNYISGYAEDGTNIHKLCMSILKDTEKVLREILGPPRDSQELTSVS